MPRYSGNDRTPRSKTRRSMLRRRGVTTSIDYETGWITYPDGAVKCVIGAPCDTGPGTMPADAFVYNWETGEEYEPTLPTAAQTGPSDGGPTTTPTCAFSTPDVASPECSTEVQTGTLQPSTPPQPQVATLPVTGAGTWVIVALGFSLFVTGLWMTIATAYKRRHS